MNLPKKHWKIQPHGRGTPLSVFDIPDEEVEVTPTNNGHRMLSPWVINGIAVVVTIIWATSFVVDMLSTEYSPPVGIHVVFTTVVGSIFGYQLVSGKEK